MMSPCTNSNHFQTVITREAPLSHGYMKQRRKQKILRKQEEEKEDEVREQGEDKRRMREGGRKGRGLWRDRKCGVVNYIDHIRVTCVVPLGYHRYLKSGTKGS